MGTSPFTTWTSNSCEEAASDQLLAILARLSSGWRARSVGVTPDRPTATPELTNVRGRYCFSPPSPPTARSSESRVEIWTGRLEPISAADLLGVSGLLWEARTWSAEWAGTTGGLRQAPCAHPRHPWACGLPLTSFAGIEPVSVQWSLPPTRVVAVLVRL